jgi:hypothetical protein
MELLNNTMNQLGRPVWGRGRRSRAARGLLFGPGARDASLDELPAMGLAAAAWEASPSTLAPDLGFRAIER